MANKDKKEFVQNLKIFLDDQNLNLRGYIDLNRNQSQSNEERVDNTNIYRSKKNNVYHNVKDKDVNSLNKQSNPSNHVIHYNRPTTSKGSLFNKRFETDSDEKEQEPNKKDQNRFFAIMDEIENKSLIDEGEKIGVLKTLILEENQNVFQIMENYAIGNYNLIELSRKLDLVARQKLEFFNERPKTPNQRKSEL